VRLTGVVRTDQLAGGALTGGVARPINKGKANGVGEGKLSWQR